MSYASDDLNLLPGETIIQAARITRVWVWVWLALAALMAIPAIAMLIGGALQGASPSIITAAFLGAVALWVEWGCKSREFVITSKRLLLKTGRVSLDVRDIPLHKIQAVRYRQGVFERLMGYGTVTVQSAGLTARESLPGVVGPRKFRDVLVAAADNSLAPTQGHAQMTAHL